MTPRETAEQIVARWNEEARYPHPTNETMAADIAEAIQAESNAQLMRNRAHDRQADVAAFVRKFGQHQETRPGFPPQEVLDMRVRLIAEEFCEFLRACGYEYRVEVALHAYAPTVCNENTFTHEGVKRGNECIHERNLPAAADGLIDMEYVILGTHVAMGIDSNPLWAAVQAANCAKEGGATRHDGKILKPENWVAPDIAGELRKQGWRDGSEA